jgi:hypothetical protein
LLFGERRGKERRSGVFPGRTSRWSAIIMVRNFASLLKHTHQRKNSCFGQRKAI